MSFAAFAKLERLILVTFPIWIELIESSFEKLRKHAFKRRSFHTQECHLKTDYACKSIKSLLLCSGYYKSGLILQCNNSLERKKKKEQEEIKRQISITF